MVCILVGFNAGDAGVGDIGENDDAGYRGCLKKTEFSGLLVLPVVCRLQYRPMGSKIFYLSYMGQRKL